MPSMMPLPIVLITIHFLISVQFLFVATSTASTAIPSNNNTTTFRDSTTTSQNETSPSTNATAPPEHFIHDVFVNTSAVLRAIYVGCGIVILVIIYNLVMTRLRRKKTKLQQYGLLKTTSDIETRPLGQEDDDETTMFDASMFKVTRS